MGFYVTTLFLAWIVGGLMFVGGAMRHDSNGRNQDFQDCLASLRRGELAAFVALAMFLAVWPVVFVGAHVAKWRS